MRLQKYILFLSVFFIVGLQISTADEFRKNSVLGKVISANQSRPIKVLCLGDSVTGIYYHTGSRRAYSNLLQTGLRQMNPGVKIDVINAGISGNTSEAGLLRIRKLLEQHKPQIVTIMFGLNDAAVRYPPADYKRNLVKMLKMVRRYGAEPILCTPNSVIENKRRPRNVVLQYAEIAREVAKEQKTPLADVYASFERIRETDVREWMMLFSDGKIHPDMLGHKLIAQEIIIALTGLKPPNDIFAITALAMPHTIKKLKDGQPVKILAMEPYGSIFKKAIMQICPNVKIEVEPWLTGSNSAKQIADDLKKRRGKEFWNTSIKADLLIIVFPQSGYSDKWDDNLKNISELLWNALVFDPSKNMKQWDVIGVSGTLLHKKASVSLVKDQCLFERLLMTRDIAIIGRSPGDDRDAADIIREWVLAQYKSKL